MNQLVTRDFCLSETSDSVPCSIVVKTSDDGLQTLWFKGTDIAKCLGYARPIKAVYDYVGPEWRSNWRDLVDVNSDVGTPKNMQPHTVFINEPGLYSLIFRSKKAESERLKKWVFADVLPSIREKGHYKFNQEIRSKLKTYSKEIIESNRTIRTMFDHIVEVSKDLVVKPAQKQLLHSFAIHRLPDGAIDNKSTTMIFTRCQRRSFGGAVKKIRKKHPDAVQVYHKNYVPNGINLLNRLKDVLRAFEPQVKCKGNTITLNGDYSTDDIIVEVKRIMKD